MYFKMLFKQPYGLINLGNTCYMNSILQILFSCDNFNKEVLQKDLKLGTMVNSYKFIIQRMIVRSNSESKIKKLKLTSFTNNFKKKFQHICNNQQDAHEALFYILGIYHTELKEKFTKKILNENIKEMICQSSIKEECVKQLNILYKNDYSIINKFFYGKLNNCVHCTACNNTINRVEIYKGIELSINECSNILECFEDYFKKETILDYKCNNCNKIACNKQIQLLSAPQYLFITLKRFKYDFNRNHFNKNVDNIIYPIYINLNNYISGNNNCKYKLIGIVNHVGNLNSGHYYSHNNFNENWINCDDETITLLPKKQLLDNRNAYILLYEKML